MADAGYGTTVGLLEPFTVGRGYPQVKAVPSPAAGAGFTYAVAGQAVENVRAVTFSYATSAVVATRVPRLDYFDGDGIRFASCSIAGSIPASVTPLVSFMVGLGATGASNGGVVEQPIPDLFLLGGHSIGVSVAGIDPGDTIFNVRIYTELFPTGPTGEPQGPITTSQP